MMDREKHAFFESVQRQQRESNERRKNDPELHKRLLLKSMSGGWGQNQKTRLKTVTLPKFSWDDK